MVISHGEQSWTTAGSLQVEGYKRDQGAEGCQGGAWFLGRAEVLLGVAAGRAQADEQQTGVSEMPGSWDVWNGGVGRSQ